MPKIIIAAALVVGALLLALSLRGGGERPQPRPPTPIKTVKPVWTESAIFSGAAPGQTADFTIARGPWRLRWEADGGPNSSSLGFTVFSKNEALAPIFEQNGVEPPDSGTITIKQSGVFYILVSSYEANWRFTVVSQNP